MIILSNLSWQKHTLDNMDPVQLDLKCVQCWGIHHFLGDIIPKVDCSHCENSPLVLNENVPKSNLHLLSLFFQGSPCEKGASIIFVVNL